MSEKGLDPIKPKYSSDIDDRPGAVGDGTEPIKPGEAKPKETRLQDIVYNQPVDHLGTHVYVKGFIDPETQRPPIIFMHDLGDSSISYQEAVRELASRGFSCFIYDQRGHGRSGSILGHIDKFDDFVSDLLQVVNWVRFKCDRKVPFIISHGMSAVSLIHFLAPFQVQVRGCMMLSPCLEGKVLGLQRSLIHLLAEIAPKFRIPLKLTPKLFTTEGSVSITAKLADEFLSHLSTLPQVFSRIRIPVHLVHPKKDSNFDYTKTFEMIGRHREKDLFQSSSVSLSDRAIKNPTEFTSVVDLMESWLLSEIALQPSSQQKDAPTEEDDGSKVTSKK